VGEQIEVAALTGDGLVGSQPQTEHLANDCALQYGDVGVPLGISFGERPDDEDIFYGKIGEEFLPVGTVSRIAYREGDAEPGGTLGDDPTWANECEGRVVRFVHLGTLPEPYQENHNIIGFIVDIREGNYKDLRSLRYADYRLDSKCQAHPQEFPLTWNGAYMFLMTPEGTGARSELTTLQKSDEQAWERFHTWLETDACMRGNFVAKTVLSVESRPSPDILVPETMTPANLNNILLP
jgi:hypothetical protein